MESLFTRTKHTKKEKMIFVGISTTLVYLFFYSTIKIFLEFQNVGNIENEPLGYFSYFISGIGSIFLGSLFTIICGYSSIYIVERIFIGKIDVSYEYREEYIFPIDFLSNKYSRPSISLFILLIIDSVDSINTVPTELSKYFSNLGIILFEENRLFLGIEIIFYNMLFVLTFFLIITVFYKRVIFRIYESNESKETEFGEDFFIPIKSFIFSLFLCIVVTFYLYFNDSPIPIEQFRIIVYSIVSSFFILFFPTLLIFRISIGKFYTRNIGFTETWLLSIVSLFIFYNLLKFLIPLFELISDFIFQILKDDLYSYQPTSVVILFYISLTIIFISFLRFIFKRGLKEQLISETLEETNL